MWGGVLSIAVRSALVVSPVRTAAVMWGIPRPGGLGQAANLPPRLGQVLVDVGGQGLEGRHVDDSDLVGQRAREGFAQEVVERAQERGEGLARARGRRDQGVRAGPDRFPAALLRGGRPAYAVSEPFGDDWMKRRQRHGPEI